MKFRKKPVVIEAVRLGWDTWSEICEFAGVGKLEDNKPSGCYLDEKGQPREGHETTDKLGLLIPTLEGLMIASEGDFIIKGVNGEFYPCKPDIFEKTYEPAKES
jgi:hypothetical protein